MFELNAAGNFENVYQDMLLQFPKNEMKEYKTFIALLKEGYYKLFCASENEEPVGYILLLEDDYNKFLWLDYIAVYRDFHSKGYGGKILKELKLKYKDYKGVYLEVEKPDESSINTLRRIKFYSDLGAQKLNLNYFYPNKAGSLAMDLYFMPLKSSKLPQKEETLTCIQSVFDKLHFDIEHIQEVLYKIN